MIDFIEIKILSGCWKAWENDSRFHFLSLMDEKTSEITRKWAKVDGLKFEIINGKNGTFALVSGSLHEYFYNGSNYNRFSFPQLVKALLKIQKDFGINPTEAIIQGFEFGVNCVNLSVSTKTILRSFLGFKTKDDEIRYGKRWHFIEIELQRYKVKLYDKAKQFGLPYPVFRFEIHVKKMIHSRDSKIVTLADLFNPDSMVVLERLLASAVNDLFLIDFRLKGKDLSKRERRILQLTKEEVSDLLESDYPKLKYLRKRSREISIQHFGNTVNDLLRAEICKEWNSLLKDSPEAILEASALQKAMRTATGNKTTIGDPLKGWGGEAATTGKPEKTYPELTAFREFYNEGFLSQINPLGIELLWGKSFHRDCEVYRTGIDRPLWRQ